LSVGVVHRHRLWPRSLAFFNLEVPFWLRSFIPSSYSKWYGVAGVAGVARGGQWHDGVALVSEGVANFFTGVVGVAGVAVKKNSWGGYGVAMGWPMGWLGATLATPTTPTRVAGVARVARVAGVARVAKNQFYLICILQLTCF